VAPAAGESLACRREKYREIQKDRSLQLIGNSRERQVECAANTFIRSPKRGEHPKAEPWKGPRSRRISCAARPLPSRRNAKCGAIIWAAVPRARLDKRCSKQIAQPRDRLSARSACGAKENTPSQASKSPSRVSELSFVAHRREDDANGSSHLGESEARFPAEEIWRNEVDRRIDRGSPIIAEDGTCGDLDL